MIVVTSEACAVDDGDGVEPFHATVNGVVRTLNTESGAQVARQVDLRLRDHDVAMYVTTELACGGDDDVVAWRSSERLVPRLRPAGSAGGEPACRIRPGGLYLVTGGLGRIGFRIGQLLLSRYAAALVVNGRSTPTGERQARLDRLAMLGEVTYLQADVADVAALRAGVAAAEQRFGRTLDGVIHLAGAEIAGVWSDLEAHLLRNEDTAEFHRMYRAKIDGTLALAEVLDERPEASLVVASSVNGFFGGTAFGAYSSASSFLPAFVDHLQRKGRAAQCHAWSLWADEEAGSLSRAAVEQHGFRAIEPDRGVELFEAALAAAASQVLIGLDDSKPGVAREIDPGAVADHGLVVTYAGAETVAPELVRDAVAATLGADVPALEVIPVAAAPASTRIGAGSDAGTLDGLEGAVAAVWESTLQQRDIGPYDHFFDLGGDSLLAMRLVARLNAEFDDVLDVQCLYEWPTVRQLAEAIRARTAAATDTDQGG